MQLRSYQKEGIEACLRHLDTSKTHPIISAAGSAGKSLMIAKLAEILNEPCLILADRKELLTQNEGKFHESCDAGVVSTGLNRREFEHQIVVGGIQTVYNKAEQLGRRDYIIVDECDLISNTPNDNTMYWQLIKQYPNARIIGLTGTPWRTGEGRLTWGDICFSVTYKDLLQMGYTSPITNKICFKPDLSGVKKIGGDYSEKSLKEQFLDKANLGIWVDQLDEFKHKRKKWLIRFPSIEYANKFAFALSAIRVRATSLTSHTSSQDRDRIMQEYREGEIQALSTVGIASRGLDVPDIDLLIDFKSTLSLKDWLQFIWRGTRLAGGKTDCGLLCFAGNLKEHGSIHNQDWLLENGEIKIKKKYVEKICPACETYIPAFAKTCPHCQYDFIQDQIKKKASLNADTESDINSEWEAKPKYNWYYVSNIIYDPEYISSKKKKMLRIIYECGPKFKMYEYLYGSNKTAWLLKRGWTYGMPIDFKKLKEPVKIAVGKQASNPQYNEIKEFQWE